MIFRNICRCKYFTAQSNTSITCFIILSKPSLPAYPLKHQYTNGWPHIIHQKRFAIFSGTYESSQKPNSLGGSPQRCSTPTPNLQSQPKLICPISHNGRCIYSVNWEEGGNSWTTKWKSWLPVLQWPLCASLSSGLGLLARLQLTGWHPAPVESLWAGPARHVSVPRPPPPALAEGTTTVTEPQQTRPGAPC